MVAILAISSVPALSWLMLLLPIVYSLHATVTNKRNTIVLLVTTFIGALVFGEDRYVLELFIMYIIPGVVIGSVSRTRIFNEESNKLEPVYIGIITNMISIVVLYIISKALFKIDLLEQYRSMMQMMVSQQLELFVSAGIDIDLSEKSIKDILTYMNNLIPTMIFFHSSIMTFIVYFVQNSIINRMKIYQFKTAKFSEFYLPGNTVMISLGMYLIIFIFSGIDIGLKVDIILTNLQSIFYCMFIIQGIALCIYYLRRWLKERRLKSIFLYSLIFGILGVVALSFLGMLDSMNDFRKVRNYKPM